LKFIADKKLRCGSRLGAVAVALALLCPGGARADMYEVSCELKADDLLPDYRGPGKTHCLDNPDEKACHDLLEQIDLMSSELRKFKTETCTKVTDTGHRLGANLGSDPQLTASIALYDGVLRRYEAMHGALDEAYGKVKQGTVPVLQDIPAGHTEDPGLKSDREKVAAVLKDKDQSKVLKVHFASPARLPTITGDVQKRAFAMRNGVSFLKELLREMQETEQAKLKLGQKLDALRVAADKIKSVPPPSSGPSGPASASAAKGSGFNPTALMGLATAAAGLAGMMNKQQADTGTPTATSPTPASMNPAEAAKPAIAVSKLDGGKSSPGKVEANPRPVDTNTAVAAPHVPAGQSFHDDSDISNSTPPPPGKTAAAASKSPGGGGGGGDAGGGLPAAREPSATPEHKEDEAMQGIAGGGLGGGGGQMGGGGGMGNASAPTDPAVVAAEESMKDLLTEMKETADGGDAAASDAQSGIMAMDAEDLFPRVRAAHVRSLKQGRVLNGLGEKITPDSE
jgi:hypothetical protein